MTEPPLAAYATKAGDDLVSAAELTEQLGVARRTVTRRVAEARAAKAKDVAQTDPT